MFFAISSVCLYFVIENSRKIYDGKTDILFEKFQLYKKITVSFEEETSVKLPEDFEILEKTPYKMSFIMPKEKARGIIKEFFENYKVKDIAIEEEDIGNVVERIYKEGSGSYYE